VALQLGWVVSPLPGRGDGVVLGVRCALHD
jgi:hypothetical protein